MPTNRLADRVTCQRCLSNTSPTRSRAAGTHGSSAGSPMSGAYTGPHRATRPVSLITESRSRNPVQLVFELTCNELPAPTRGAETEARLLGVPAELRLGRDTTLDLAAGRACLAMNGNSERIAGGPVRSDDDHGSRSRRYGAGGSWTLISRSVRSATFVGRN